MAQPKVFVSHSHVDDAFAEQLVNDLRMAGADAWLDKEDLGAGDFQERISEALGKCEWFVLVLTRSALASPWVTQEVHAANRLKHQRRIRNLIFLQAGTLEQHEIPALWGVYNIFDAINDYRMALAKTLGAIGIVSTARIAANTPTFFQFDAIQFDVSRREVRVNGRVEHLTDSESRILQLLAANMGQVCTTEQIVEHTWGYAERGDVFLLKAHIRHLREKIEPVPDEPRYIVTDPDVGYVLMPLASMSDFD